MIKVNLGPLSSLTGRFAQNCKMTKKSSSTKPPHGEHVNMDIWHGLLPNEDTAILVKNDGDFLMRGIEKGSEFNIILSVRWGKNVSAFERFFSINSLIAGL